MDRKKHIKDRKTEGVLMQYIAHIFAISTISLALSGCVAHNSEPKPNITDLNISKNSQIVEYENVKLATAILIKKSEQIDRLGVEQKSLSSMLNDSSTKIRELNTKNEDLSMKILFLTDEVNKLQNEISAFKSKQKELSSEIAPLSIEQNEPANQTVPVLKVESLPNSKVENKKPNSTAKYQSVAKKPIQKCQNDAPKKKILNAAPIIETFSPREGKIIVNRKNVFVRSEPIAEKRYVSDSVNDGDVFTYVAESRSWYKLKSGNYISKKVAVDLSVSKKGQK